MILKTHDTAEELYKLALIPIFLGFLSSIAVIVMIQLYQIFSYIFETIVKYSWYLILVLPLSGLMASFILNQYLTKDKFSGCGTDLMIETYHHRNGIIDIKDVLIKTLSSTITLGFGGSGGLEGPSLLLGGGTASYILEKLKLKPKDIKLLYLCGAAAGFTALFKAPFTGILLALEIPYRRDIEKDAFIPAALSSVSAYIFSVLFFGGESIFSTNASAIIQTHLLFHSIFLGIITSIIALVFIKSLEKTKKIFELISSKTNLIISVIIGGFTIGLIGIFYPQVLGIGYDTIKTITSTSNGETFIQTLIIILILKIVATSLTISSRGSVGLFLPALYVGGLSGLIYAQALNLHPASVYAIIGMGAVVAATTKSLLTGIVFVAETVGSSPIMFALLSASISYFLTGRNSFYESQLNKKPSNKMEALMELEEFFRERKDLLPNLKISSIKLRKPVYFTVDTMVKDVLKTVRTNVYRTYPIVNDKNQILGVIDIESIFTIEKEKWDISISDLELKKPLLATREQVLIEVVEKMLETSEDHVFIVNNMEDRIIEGVITASDIIKIFVEKMVSI
ncbi:MAG: chloride channel protein [Nitrososphaeria archaeon]|nr:chloride channel protein [Nitrososphaeria archaeon]